MPGLELMGKIGLDGKAFEAELNKAHHLAKGVAEGVTDALKRAVITGVGIGTVEEAIRKTVETVDELVDSSKRLGIAPEQLQVLRRAAKEAGVEIGTLAKAFEKLDQARRSALEGGPEGQKKLAAFAGLGIGFDDLQTMSAAQLFRGPLAAAARNRNPEEIGPMLNEVMGKGFGPLIGVMRTDMDELGKKMRELGAVLTSDDIAQLKLFKEQISFLGDAIVAIVLPALVKLGELLIKVVAGLDATWAALKSFFSDKNSINAMSDIMKATPGFGGPSAGQIKEQGILGTTKYEDQGRWGRAKAAGAARFATWEDKLRSMAESAFGLSWELSHPASPDFTSGITSAFDKEPKEARVARFPTLRSGDSDSLVKVGNFFGGRGVAGLEIRKVDLLTQIANNTRAMAQARNALAVGTNASKHITDTLVKIFYPHR